MLRAYHPWNAIRFSLSVALKGPAGTPKSGSKASSWSGNEAEAKANMGVRQNETTRGPRVLVHVATYKDKPFWGYPTFDPQPYVSK